METSLESAHGMILTTGEGDDVHCDCENVLEQHVDLETATEQEGDSIVRTCQRMVFKDVEEQVKNALATIVELVEEAVEPLF